MVIALADVVGSGELWLEIAKIICGTTPQDEYSSMCDLMCHRAPYTPQLGFWDRTFVDIQDRGLDFEKEKLLNFVHMDVFDFFEQNTVHYNVMICSDGIEHLTIDQGKDLIWWMENASEKQIVFTPLGDHMVGLGDLNSPDTHRSGWLPEMIPDYLSIVFPNWHPELGIGAFFAINCSGVEKQRIYNEIKSKYVREDKAD